MILLLVFILLGSLATSFELFTSLDEVVYVKHAINDQAKPYQPHWDATLSWAIKGTEVHPSDHFYLKMPCVFKFITDQTYVPLKAGSIEYGQCHFKPAEVFSTYSELDCVISSTVSASTNAKGTIRFPFTFNVGGSALDADLKCAKTFTSGSNVIAFSEGKKFTYTVEFDAGSSYNPDGTFFARTVPSVKKFQTYLVAGDCSKGYLSGTLGLQITNSNAKIDCSSFHANMTNQFNSWMMAGTADSITRTISCVDNKLEVNYKNIPAGYKPYLDAFLIPTDGHSIKMVYFNRYKCIGDDNQTNHDANYEWTAYDNSDPNSEGEDGFPAIGTELSSEDNDYFETDCEEEDTSSETWADILTETTGDEEFETDCEEEEKSSNTEIISVLPSITEVDNIETDCEEVTSYIIETGDIISIQTPNDDYSTTDCEDNEPSSTGENILLETETNNNYSFETDCEEQETTSKVEISSEIFYATTDSEEETSPTTETTYNIISTEDINSTEETVSKVESFSESSTEATDDDGYETDCEEEHTSSETWFDSSISTAEVVSTDTNCDDQELSSTIDKETQSTQVTTDDDGYETDCEEEYASSETWSDILTETMECEDDETFITTKTWTKSTTEITTVAVVAHKQSIIIQIPIPTVSTTTTYTGISTYSSTVTAIIGETATVIVQSPTDTTTTVTQCWNENYNTTNLILDTIAATHTLEILIPCEHDSTDTTESKMYSNEPFVATSNDLSKPNETLTEFSTKVDVESSSSSIQDYDKTTKDILVSSIKPVEPSSYISAKNTIQSFIQIGTGEESTESSDIQSTQNPDETTDQDSIQFSTNPLELSHAYTVSTYFTELTIESAIAKNTDLSSPTEVAASTEHDYSIESTNNKSSYDGEFYTQLSSVSSDDTGETQISPDILSSVDYKPRTSSETKTDVTFISTLTSTVRDPLEESTTMFTTRNGKVSSGIVIHTITDIVDTTDAVSEMLTKNTESKETSVGDMKSEDLNDVDRETSSGNEPEYKTDSVNDAENYNDNVVGTSDELNSITQGTRILNGIDQLADLEESQEQNVQADKTAEVDQNTYSNSGRGQSLRNETSTFFSPSVIGTESTLDPSTGVASGIMVNRSFLILICFIVYII
nr:agglutinin-like protein [Spathaspora passalidarum]